MSRWFRFYDEVLDDPKVQALDAEDYRGWVNILCVASRNNGRITEGKALAFALRMSEIDAGSLVDRLLIAGLIDRVKGGANGAHIAPHNWAKRQYKSDTSTDRVKRFRERSATVTETAPDTDTDTDKKEEVFCPKPVRTRKAYSGEFERFWSDFPTDPLMSKKDASAAFEKLDADDRKKLFLSLANFRAYCAKQTDYRPVHAVRYITQRRFDGFAPAASSTFSPQAEQPRQFATEEEFQAWWDSRFDLPAESTAQ